MDRLIKAAKEYLEATARDPLMASQQYYRDELTAALTAAEAIPTQPASDAGTPVLVVNDPNDPGTPLVVDGKPVVTGD